MKKGSVKGYDNGVQGTKGYKLEILQITDVSEKCCLIQEFQR